MVGNFALVLLTIKMALLVKSGAQKQECFSEKEMVLEIHAALSTLTESLDSLKKDLNETKEMIDKIENRTLTQDENLERALFQMKEEIITETETMLPPSQLTSINIVSKIKTDEATNEVKINKTRPSDCKEVQENGNNLSGTYQIHPTLSKFPFRVWCDMKTEKGGWTYLLNRFDGSQNFHLNWTDYKQGFGNFSGEHWLGLEHMYELTNSKTYQLLIELVDWKSITAQAFYSNFRIGNESEAYPVKSVGTFSGNAGDSFTRLDAKFSTPDRDNDLNTDEESCAQYFRSGWWFINCYRSLLTGQYITNPASSTDYSDESSINWHTFHGYDYSLKEARMMIRPVS